MDYLEWGLEVLQYEIDALKELKNRLSADFGTAAGIIEKCEGRVIVTGIGKSGHVGKKIAATMASLGTLSIFMHSTEALHGDSGMMSKGDVVIAISNSGATTEVVAAAGIAKQMGNIVIAMTGNRHSELGLCADVVLDIGVEREADHLGLAPTSSSTVTLALGDALAVAVSRAKGFGPADFAFCHPGGALGRKSRKRDD